MKSPPSGATKSPQSSQSQQPPPRPPPPDAGLLKSRHHQHHHHHRSNKSKVAGSSTKSVAPGGGGGGGQPHQQQVSPSSPTSSGSGGLHKPLMPVRPAPPPPSQPGETPPLAEYGPASGLLAAAGPAAAAHVAQHSYSSSAANPDAFARSAPTLGTITASPQETSPHVSPFPAQQQQPSSSSAPLGTQPSPSGGPTSTATTGTPSSAQTSSSGATAAAASTTAALTPTKGATPTSSINTGTTPLTTTPGGTSKPIKLTMSGLAAAIAGGQATQGGGSFLAANANTTRSGMGSSGRPPSGERSPTDHRGSSTIVAMGGPSNSTDGGPSSKQAAAEPGDAAPAATSKQPSVSQLGQSGRSYSCNMAIYISLSIFLLAILALIIIFVVNRKK